MRKILSILASVGLTATAASAVVACGNTDKNGVVQSGSLGSIVKSADRTVSGNADMTSADKALSAFLETAAGKRLKKENVQVKENSFEAAGPGTNGKLVIQAKSGTKYTGEITITIKGYTVTLDSIKSTLTLEIPGSEGMTADSALTAFKSIGNNASVKDEVEVKSGDGNFVAPKNDTVGKLVITAKSGSTKYTGDLEITIKGYTVTLESIKANLTLEIPGSENMTADSALAAFLAVDANKTLRDEVEVKSGDGNFVAPKNDTVGKLVITAKSGSTKYTGDLEITIKGYTVTLESIKANLTLEIPGSENMTADSALAAFLAVDANKTLRDEVEVKGDAESFDAPKNGVDGKLVITAKSSSTKYTGVLEITISKLKSSAEPTTPEGQNKERVSSSNDDHKVTIITLSTEDALRLGYIKQDGDKFVAGDKLPNGPLTTKVGESTITATFTPNFENGTVQVVLTVDTPSNN